MNVKTKPSDEELDQELDNDSQCLDNQQFCKDCHIVGTS